MSVDTDMPETGDPRLLSVVIITRNQEQFVERLIKSVLAELRAFTPTEIFLVDSASKDATVSVASRHPVRVLRIRRDVRLTPPAGRYIGFHHTTGDLILFIDGDMELCAGWLAKAVELIQSDATIAAVTGIVVDPGDRGIEREREEAPPRIVEVPWWRAGGIALYRREAMVRCGTFNPGLYSDGEPELWLRLQRAGYHVYRLEQLAAIHYGDAPRDVARRTFSSLLARRRRRLFLGYGQIVRLLLGDRRLWTYLRHRGYGLIPLAGLALGLAALGWLLVAGMWIGIAIWSGAVALAIIADAIRKRSLYRAAYSVLNRLFVVEGMVRGFAFPPVNPTSFLEAVDVVATDLPRVASSPPES